VDRRHVVRGKGVLLVSRHRLVDRCQARRRFTYQRIRVTASGYIPEDWPVQRCLRLIAATRARPLVTNERARLAGSGYVRPRAPPNRRRDGAAKPAARRLE
jgi:hypothetical protein